MSQEFFLLQPNGPGQPVQVVTGGAWQGGLPGSSDGGVGAGGAGRSEAGQGHLVPGDELRDGKTAFTFLLIEGCAKL